ncbi:dinitrogenase reductase activating glycohydrolase (draG) [Brevifollis gellanilyticus]|uniref:Dinitrogenase reductase activating glycohydrolase (DraG) n=2 Tax=Brevifollis gellanilyticus TaxID=748831 RepID=A0A512MAT0_9BACT|nr:dinitrogenase reductase activating glycohydrolase (draG) [Brevifollis gellanilyticus]
MTPMKHDTHQPILGTLLGTAVGDSIGLPFEGMSRRRVAALGEVRHQLVFGRGMFSDDTEHTLMLASAWIENRHDIQAFQAAFGRKLRWWLLALPAGVGLSTAKAILRLWLGFPSTRSGVRSAGNGAAMRSAIIGVLHRHDETARRELTLAACRVTHTDMRAEESALWVAEAAAMASNDIATSDVLTRLETLIISDEMRSRFSSLQAALKDKKTVPEYAELIGCGRGVTGFAPNTIAVATYAWLRHRGQFETQVREVIACGGDTDTVAAILGGISGAEVGEAGIPRVWLDGICDWPRSADYIRGMAEALTHEKAKAPKLCWQALPLRNLFFLLVVIVHGFRRLLLPR